MKSILVFPFAILISIQMYSQNLENDKFTLYLSLKDSMGVSVANKDLWLSDKESGLHFPGKTNAKGQCNIILVKGRTYTLNFTGAENYAEIKTPALSSSKNFITKSIVYSGVSEQSSAMNSADTIRQKYTSVPLVTKSESAIIVKVMDAESNILKDVNVRLKCSSTKIVYTSNTNKEGSAYFLVPANEKYEVGIESYDNYSELSLLGEPKKMVKGIRYQPTIISETASNDTVMQVIPATQGPTSERVHITAMVSDLNGISLPDEEIYIDVVDENTVYKAVTNNNGKAQFLIPKGKEYVLHFRYERNVDRLDYSLIDPLAMHDVEIEYQYIGTKKVQEFYKSVNRDENGFITEFMQMNVDKISTFDNSKVVKTSLGYNIDFSDDYMPSALAISEKIYVGGGAGDEFYCLDAKTATFQWGVKFSENGQSSAVYDSGVILVSTESCTLYAIDKNTGTLLWSKWLGPYLYSTPSVKNGRVFVTYPNDIDNIEEDRYVLLCLDLNTGDIEWQTRIDKEVVSAPVVTEDKVYLTTLSGKLYSLNVSNGSGLLEKDANAVCPPTIANGLLYVSLRDTAKNIRELAIFDALTLSEVKRIPEISSVDNGRDYSMDYKIAMNYNANRTVNYNGNNYNFAGSKLVCSKGSDGSVIWTDELADNNTSEQNTSNIPVVAGGKIIVTTLDGKIKVYDPSSGKVIKEFETDAFLVTSPVVWNGWIYAGSADGKLISLDTKDATYTGWGMWNQNGTHNTAIEQ